MGISKKLLNDRLKVTVGSSFGLEGPQKNQEASTIAGDVAIEYQLSKDGRYKLKCIGSINIKWRFKAKWLKQSCFCNNFRLQ
jgi:hypothetical protein